MRKLLAVLLMLSVAAFVGCKKDPTKAPTGASGTLAPKDTGPKDTGPKGTELKLTVADAEVKEKETVDIKVTREGGDMTKELDVEVTADTDSKLKAPAKAKFEADKKEVTIKVEAPEGAQDGTVTIKAGGKEAKVKVTVKKGG